MVATRYVITLQLLVTAFASSGNRVLLLALSTSITNGHSITVSEGLCTCMYVNKRCHAEQTFYLWTSQN